MNVLMTDSYDYWFRKLKDGVAKAKITARVRRIQISEVLIGDWKPVGDKVIELRFDYGPGYRVYAYFENTVLLLLLIGGDKSSRRTDIEQAKKLLKEWRRDNER